MPTLEPDFEAAEAINIEAAIHGGFTPAQAEWIEAFYRNVESRMLNLYDGARLRAGRISEAKKLADHWQEQTEWFAQMLDSMRRREKTVANLGIEKPEALGSLIETLNDIVAACRGAYEFHA
jgi:hypothetical protein